MKVGILVPYSWSYRGGVIDHADQQARALQRLGIETSAGIAYGLGFFAEEGISFTALRKATGEAARDIADGESDAI